MKRESKAERPCRHSGGQQPFGESNRMNNFAISSEGLGEAMKRSAAALALAGNSLDESLALVTGANEIVQSPEVVGTWAKTLTMYLRAAKVEAENAGVETEGMANSVSELRESILKLTGNKVDIMVNDTEFKSTLQIMREIASVYDSLTDVDQAALLKLLSGKRQANTTAALLSNWSTVEEVIQSSANSMGSAAAENEKYLDSIEGKTQQFSAQFQALSTQVLDSELIKGVFDTGTGFLGFLTNTIEKLGTLKGLIVPIISMLTTLQNKGLFRANPDNNVLSGIKFSSPTNWAKNIPGYFSQSAQIKADQTSLNNFINGLKELNQTNIRDAFKNITPELENAFNGASESCKNFRIELQGTAATYEEADYMCRKYIDDQTSSMYSTNAFAKAARGAAAGIKMMAAAFVQMLVINVIISLVQKLVGWLDSLHMSAKEAAEVTQKAVSDFENQRAAIDGNVKTVESLRDRYAELSRGVNDLGENVALSADEYAEYKNIVQQIVDITPSVIQGYNDEGEAILNRNDLIQQSIDLLKQERIEKAKNAVWSKDGNDGGKSNLEASIIDFDANYRKQQFEAEKAAMEFSDFLGQVFRSTKEDDDLASFQKVIEKYAGATVDSLGTIQTVGKGGRISEHQANVYDLLTQKSDELASRSAELIKELEQIGIVSDEAASKASTLGSEYEVAAGEVEQSASSVKSFMEGIFESEEDYYDLDKNSQSFLNSLIESMSAEQTKVLTDQGADKLASSVQDMLLAVSSNPDIQSAIGDLFSLEADASNMSLWDYASRKDSLVDQITSAFSEAGIDANAVIKVLPHAEIDSNAMIQEIQSKVQDPAVLARIQALTMDEQIKVYYALTDVGKMSPEEFEKWLQKMRRDGANGIKVKLTINDIQDDLSTLGETFNNLNSILQDFDEYKVIDTDALGALVEQFKDIEGVDIEGYVASITKAGTTSSKLKSETNKLITSILLENDAFRNVNEATADNVAAMLESNGVTNARALVAAQLKANLDQEKLAEYEAANGAIAFGSAESMNIDTLVAVANQLGVSKAALFQYMMQKINANAVTISTDGDIANVMALANACGVASRTISAFLSIKQSLAGAEYELSQAKAENNQLKIKGWSDNVESLKKAASNLSSQINTSLSAGAVNSVGGANYGGNVRNSNGGSKSGSGGGSSTDPWLEAYEKERATLDYQREKDLINEQQYYDGIEALWKKYFKGRAKYLEKDRELDLELYEMRQSLAEDWISDQQHEIDMLSKRTGTEQKQIEIYRQLMNKVHALAEEARSRGLSDNEEYIQNLQKQWWEFSEAIDDLNQQMLDSAIEKMDNALSALETYIEQMDTYESWGNDNAYEARKRYIEIIDHAFDLALISEEEYQERRIEAEKQAFEALKKIREDELNKQKEAAEAAISVVEDRIDQEIEALEKQKKALQDKNDEEDRAIELQKLQDALDAAKRNKNRRTYYEDKGKQTCPRTTISVKTRARARPSKD